MSKEGYIDHDYGGSEITGNSVQPNKSETSITHQQDDYDPHQHANHESPTSYLGTVFHLFIISAGPAILTIPISFIEVGWVLAFPVIFIVTWLYAYNIHMIVLSAYHVCKSKRLAHLSYPQLVYHAFNDGPEWMRKFSSAARLLIQIIFILLWLSMCCYDIVVIAENLKLTWYVVNGSTISEHFILLWSFIPILALCWIRKLSYLVPISVIGNVLNFICILVILYDIVLNGEPFNGAPAFGSIPALVGFIGSIFITLNATGIILPLKNEMKKPHKFDGFKGALGVTYVPVSFVLSFFSLLCALKYGVALKDTVIQNLEENNTFLVTMILFSTISLMAQYPLYAFVIYDIIWNDFMQDYQKNWEHPIVGEYAVRTGINVLVLLLAYAVPNVALFITLGGSVLTALDSLIFPAVVQTLVMRNLNLNKGNFSWYLGKNVIIVIFAVILLVTGAVQSIDNIIEYYSTNHES